MTEQFKLIRPTTVTDSAGSYTRSTTGTYYGADGLLKTAAINVPRLNYDPATLQYAGLLVEPAATNLVTYSAQLDHAAWVKTSASVTANTATAPDGTLAADSLIEASDTAQVHQVQANATITSLATYTASVYAKANTRTKCRLVFLVGAGDVYADADLSAGTIGTATAFSGATAVGSAAITPVGNGWYRIGVSGVGPAGTTGGLRVELLDGSGNRSYNGNGSSGLYLWGAQLELGAAATSLIPTVAAAVTRAADVITGTGLIYSPVPETDFTAWNAATNYTVGTKVMRAVTGGVHSNFQCLIAGVDATLPELATKKYLTTPRWLDLGATKKWAMFDRKVGTATTASDSLTVLLKPGRINSLALLQIDAASVTVDLNVAGQTVYSASMNLTSGNLVGDWYQYFYEPVYQQDALVITDLVDATLLDLPAYGEGVLTVTFSRPGGTVSCGVCVVGLYAEVGKTLYKPTIGIVDYSQKDVDTFGNEDITVRDYSKRMSAQTVVDRAAVDYVARILAQYRSALLVWVGAGNMYTSMIIYGFYKDWEITIDEYAISTLSIQVEGLAGGNVT
jgi:hypothetical protein